MKILIIDDDDIVRRMFGDTVTSFGYTPHTVRSVEEALTYLDSNKVDVILSDNDLGSGHMPGYQGTFLFKERFPHVGVILTSGRAEPERHGADKFLAKPVKPFDLFETINKVKPPTPEAA